MNVEDLSIAEVARLYRRGDVTPIDVTEVCLDRIARFDGPLRSFITVTADEARASARRAWRELRRGVDRGPLHGVPIALKDLVETRGVLTTAGSAVLHDYVPQTDAPIVVALRGAGAVLIGKTNMQEFANGVPHPDFGQTRNPWTVARTAGGSSGGSAAAVVAGFCYGAVGSDTGGSIRVPASYCGCVGLKPTYGLVSTTGVFPLSWSLDHVGPMARTARDAGLLLGAMTAEPRRVRAAAPKRLRLGVINSHASGPELSAEARRSFLDACLAIERAGAHLVDVSIPDLELSEGLLTTIVGPESTVVHSRWLDERPQLYASRTRHQLEFGYAVPAVKYLRAQQYRRHLADRFRAALDGLDALLSPTVAWAAPEEDPSIMSSAGQAEGRRTTPYNMIGCPALPVPSGCDSEGLPFGLQIATLPYTDWKTLAIGATFDDLELMGNRRPPLVESPG